ncbi:AAA family ATPase [Amycolatopsis alba]|uniref:AAA family ATPase n=1 Tax=Amycolatopsis alba DSM 44262 TaxID=1125972 RepID=A0A229RDI9_AMYAL|nr:AAA family ATPase [Amycolatopsis alba]OXM44494.1 AAA family ATPase [Amycolatopsis alba DSM 44262]
MTTNATTPATGTAPAAPGAANRLRGGELRRMVAELLTQQPGNAGLTAGAAARLLSRSSGAVGNALETLASRGEADYMGQPSRAYRANANTAAAATAVISTRTTEPATATAATPPVTPKRAPWPKAPALVTTPVRRPNGQLYHPRKLAGSSDVTVLRRLRQNKIPSLLYGPPGTGKTSLVEAAFGDAVTLPGDSDTTVDDIVGGYVPALGGTYEFAHGPLVTAMREGRAFFIDDFTLIPAPVLAVVYPVMDGRGHITIKTNNWERVDAAPGFYVVGGHNPGVHGAVLSPALASRFRVKIEVTTDYDLAARIGVDPKAVRVAKNLAARHRKGEIGWAPQMRELLAFKDATAALDTITAAGNLIAAAPEEDQDIVADVVRNIFGAHVTPLAVGEQF